MFIRQLLICDAHKFVHGSFALKFSILLEIFQKPQESFWRLAHSLIDLMSLNELYNLQFEVKIMHTHWQILVNIKATSNSLVLLNQKIINKCEAFET